MCRSAELTYEFAMEYAENHGVDVWMDGKGVIGALAALPWFARPDDSVIMDAELP